MPIRPIKFGATPPREDAVPEPDLASSRRLAGPKFSAKVPMVGRWVAVLDHARRDRGLVLNSHSTRCIHAGEIHEFLVCRTPPGQRTGAIDAVSYLGFGEFLVAGVIALGDELWVQGQPLGEVIGFDETHMPNHQNIVIYSDNTACGSELGLVPYDLFHLECPQEERHA